TGIGIGEVVQSVCVFDGHLYLGTNTGFYRKPFMATSIAPLSRVQIKIYPIPSRDKVYLEGVEAGSPIRIVSLMGQTVMKTRLGEDNSLQIESLAIGSYFLICDEKFAR